MNQNKEELSLLGWGRWCHVREGRGARAACASLSLGQDNICKPRRELSPGRMRGLGWNWFNLWCKTPRLVPEVWSWAIVYWFGKIEVSLNARRVAVGASQLERVRMRDSHWGAGRGGAGRERMSPKIALTTACPGGYFSFLYYRQGKRDSDVGSVVDLVSAPPHVLGYLEVTPEAPICAHGFLRLFSGTFSGLGSVGELIHQEQPSTRELMANTSTCLFLDKTVFFIGSKNSLCKIYHLNYFLCLPYVVWTICTLCNRSQELFIL